MWFYVRSFGALVRLTVRLSYAASTRSF